MAMSRAGSKKRVTVLDGGSKDWVVAVLARLSEDKMYPYLFEVYPMHSVTWEALMAGVDHVKSRGESFVLSLTEETVLAMAVINDKLWYPAPSVLSIAHCLNKFLTRSFVRDMKWFFGFNLEDDIEKVIKKVVAYPCMLKPTTLCFGLGAFRCDSEADLRTKWQTVKGDAKICHELIHNHTSHVSLLSRVGLSSLASKCTQYLLEEFVETHSCDTHQYCMEAFVTRYGVVVPYSLVEEITFKNGMFLAHTIPPYHFDGDFQPYEDYVMSIGQELFSLGFKNQSFNIEFWRLSDGTFKLIEINPRNSMSYRDIFLAYSGNDLFHDSTRLVIENKLPEVTPYSKLKQNWMLAGGKDIQFVAGIPFTTLARGKRSDLFNYDFLNELEQKGIRVHYFKPKDSTLTDSDITLNGGCTVMVTLRGSWREIVTDSKKMRIKFYKDMSNCLEATLYPDCFN